MAPGGSAARYGFRALPIEIKSSLTQHALDWRVCAANQELFPGFGGILVYSFLSSRLLAGTLCNANWVHTDR